MSSLSESLALPSFPPIPSLSRPSYIIGAAAILCVLYGAFVVAPLHQERIELAIDADKLDRDAALLAREVAKVANIDREVQQLSAQLAAPGSSRDWLELAIARTGGATNDLRLVRFRDQGVPAGSASADMNVAVRGKFEALMAFLTAAASAPITEPFHDLRLTASGEEQVLELIAMTKNTAPGKLEDSPACEARFARNPFVFAAPAAEAITTAPISSLRLLGTMIGGGVRRAIVSVGGSMGLVVDVGGLVAGARVAAIGSDRISLESADGERATLSLESTSRSPQ